jgi:hypothetical protein
MTQHLSSLAPPHSHTEVFSIGVVARDDCPGRFRRPAACKKPDDVTLMEISTEVFEFYYRLRMCLDANVGDPKYPHKKVFVVLSFDYL